VLASPCLLADEGPDCGPGDRERGFLGLTGVSGKNQMHGLITSGPERKLSTTGGSYVRRAESLSEEDRVLFQTVARVVFTILPRPGRAGGTRVSAERVSTG